MNERPRTIAKAAATPMMAQYQAIKADHPDSLLFYRMGDFYELFFDDAVVAARDLGITLTRRGKHQGEDIPMCGVPVHAADQYLQKLIAKGHRVAVCEQTEDPQAAKKRGAKAVVRRDVVRLVTPGTLTEDTLLEPGANNHLAAVARVRGHRDGEAYGLAWIDMSTGEFRLTEGDRDRLAATLSRIAPSEVVLPSALEEVVAPDGPDTIEAMLTPLPAAFFDSATASERLTAYFEVATLDAFGTFGPAGLAAAAAIVAYVERTQLGARPPLRPPVQETAGQAMLIDAATRANLELVRTLGGTRGGSLLAAIDRTVTGAGARLLERRLASPLTEPAKIGERLDSVASLVDQTPLREALRTALAAAPDLARPLTRLTLDRGGPRDLAAIRDGLQAAVEIAELLAAADLPAELATVCDTVAAAPSDVVATLTAALDEAPPPLKRDGNFIRAGFDADLDDTRRLRDDSRRLIAGLQADYAEAAEVRNLRIKHNNVLGYFIEVASAHGERLLRPPHDARFIHRQTLASAMRFTTSELADLDRRIAGAADRALELEFDIFARLATDIVAVGDNVRAVADALAVLDVTAALATLAVAENHARPVVDGSLAFEITGGRHPVVEQALRGGSEGPFVANDCDLSPPADAEAGRIWLLTGPNMAGKSTFLRQNALITLLAQIGAYVPATSARIGVVDRLFSRVGAADDLARGRSTFMVEMVETAAILNQAGERALVILDEIGRGTATFDGLSIAWAAIEHLHETNRSRALFATHYHELTALADRLPRLDNHTVRVREWHDEVVFLHEIAAGTADRSYGVQVARLAGLPPAVVERARDVLARLERSDRAAPVDDLFDGLPLFTAAPEPAAADPVVEALDGIVADDLTPREALDLIYRLKRLRSSGD